MIFRSLHSMSCLAALVLMTALVTACSSKPPPNPNPRAAVPLVLAPEVDLQRYVGRWFVIANIPYSAERGYVGSYDEYQLLPDDGGVSDSYFGHKQRFEAPLKQKKLKVQILPGSHNAVWRASPFWPLFYNFMILYVDPDYRFALLGFPTKEVGWVLARSPEISDADYQTLLGKFDDQGYDISRFKRVPQTPDQLGKPGFQTP